MKMNAFEIDEDHALLELQIARHDVNMNILDFLDEVPPEQQIRMRGEDIMADPRTHPARSRAGRPARRRRGDRGNDASGASPPFACFGLVTALFGNDRTSGPTFRPHKLKIPALDAELLWRKDGKRLYPRGVVELAREFGYA